MPLSVKSDQPDIRHWFHERRPSVVFFALIAGNRHLIATIALGFVESTISPFAQCLGAFARLPAGHTATEGDGEFAFTGRLLQFGKALTNIVQHLAGAFRAGAGENDGKFLTAVTADVVGFSQPLFQDALPI